MTKTLVIAGEGGFFTTPSGQRGAMLRAYNKGTGDEVGAVFMPAPQTGSPMTYRLNGQQFLVVATSGGGYSGELVAFRSLAWAQPRANDGNRIRSGSIYVADRPSDDSKDFDQSCTACCSRYRWRQPGSVATACSARLSRDDRRAEVRSGPRVAAEASQ